MIIIVTLGRRVQLMPYSSQYLQCEYCGSVLRHSGDKCFRCPHKAANEVALAVYKGLGTSWVNREQIVLAVWRLYANRFGLPGYEDKYPDSGKIVWYLTGRRGVVSLGLLEKSKGKYRLTQKGEALARRLTEPVDE